MGSKDYFSKWKKSHGSFLIFQLALEYDLCCRWFSVPKFETAELEKQALE